MLIVSNNLTSNNSFTGYYFGDISQLSKEAKELSEAGTRVLIESKEFLTNIQNIQRGKYVLSNVDKPSKVIPRLSAEVDQKEVILTPYFDGFTLQVKNPEATDLVTVWGGDSVEFESTKFPLKPDEYKLFSGPVLQRVESLISKYIPIFTKE